MSGLETPLTPHLLELANTSTILVLLLNHYVNILKVLIITGGWWLSCHLDDCLQDLVFWGLGALDF